MTIRGLLRQPLVCKRGFTVSHVREKGFAILRGLLISVFLAALMITPALGHDWMPQETRWCCSERDCLAAPSSAIRRTATGWVIQSTGQEFKEGERGVYPNIRPDLADVWICKMPTEEKARCIMIEPEGS